MSLSYLSTSLPPSETQNIQVNNLIVNGTITGGGVGPLPTPEISTNIITVVPAATVITGTTTLTTAQMTVNSNFTVQPATSSFTITLPLASTLDDDTAYTFTFATGVDYTITFEVPAPVAPATQQYIYSTTGIAPTTTYVISNNASLNNIQTVQLQVIPPLVSPQNVPAGNAPVGNQWFVRTSVSSIATIPLAFNTESFNGDLVTLSAQNLSTVQYFFTTYPDGGMSFVLPDPTVTTPPTFANTFYYFTDLRNIAEVNTGWIVFSVTGTHSIYSPTLAPATSVYYYNNSTVLAVNNSWTLICSLVSGVYSWIITSVTPGVTATSVAP